MQLHLGRQQKIPFNIDTLQFCLLYFIFLFERLKVFVV